MEKLRSKFFKRSKNSKKNTTNAASASAASMEEESSDTSLTIEYFQYQFLIDCLLKIPWTSDDDEELMKLLGGQIATDHDELQNLNEFKTRYSSNRALSWYLRDCFLYKILNNALTSEDLRSLVLFRNFLGDLMTQMIKFRSKNPIRVYRSQMVNIETLDRWISSVGQCITVNSFLSATKSYEVAMAFLRTSQPIPNNFERILFEIDADPRIVDSKPFVELSSFNDSNDKNEVLFMFGSIFLINNIRSSDEGFFVIEVTLYTDADHPIKNEFDMIRRNYFDEQFDILRFAEILSDFDRSKDAEYYVKTYFDSLPTNHDDRVRSLNVLGTIYAQMNDYDTSIYWYKMALKLSSSLSPLSTKNKLDLAKTHDNIAGIYMKTNSLELAVTHYWEAVNIKRTCLSSHDISIGLSYENLGCVYERMGNHVEALEHFQHAKMIYQRTSPDDHNRLSVIEEHIRRLS